MFEFSLEDFDLKIQPISKSYEEPGGPYLEWIDFRIEILTKDVQANGQWNAMPTEVKKFYDQLQNMNTKLEKGLKAELSGVEKNFRLNLTLEKQGVISGEWFFQPDFPNGSNFAGGKIAFDQSYLEEILQSTEQLF